MRLRTVLGLGLATLMAAGGGSSAGAASPPRFVFTSIDGGEIDLAAFAGRPVLVVNTASRCGFTGQYDGLQALYDHYRASGLVVLGVPSDSFNQELASGAAVKEFCEVNFAIDFPMTGITPVTGPDAHPFYAWAQDQGIAPGWNFHKILLDGDGRIAGDFGTTTGPDSPQIAEAIEALLPAAN